MPLKRNSSSNSLVGFIESMQNSGSSVVNAISTGTKSTISTIGAINTTTFNTIHTIGNGTIDTIATISTVPTNLVSKPKIPTGLTTELCLQDFKEFVSQDLSQEESIDFDVVDELFHTLALHNQRDVLQGLEDGLSSLLKSKHSLPTPIVAQLHAYLGMVYMELNNYNSAEDSFMRSIWFQSRTPEDTLAIALANHRLG